MHPPEPAVAHDAIFPHSPSVSSPRRSSVASTTPLQPHLATTATPPLHALPSRTQQPPAVLRGNHDDTRLDLRHDNDAPAIMLKPLTATSPISAHDAALVEPSEPMSPVYSNSEPDFTGGSSDALHPGPVPATQTTHPRPRVTLPHSHVHGNMRPSSNVLPGNATNPRGAGSRPHSRQSSVASSANHPSNTSRSRPTSGTSTLRTRTRRAHHARSTMYSILLSSWTSMSLWTKLRIYFATLYTLAEAALPLAASVVAHAYPPEEFSPCAGYIRLNLSTAVVACGLLFLLPATIRWEMIQRQQARWDRLERDGDSTRAQEALGERPQLNTLDQFLSFVRSLLNITHFVLFIVANLQLFRIRPGIQQCPESPAVFSLTLAWIILFYCKMFLPVTIMMLGCLCLPLLLLLATHLNRRYAEQQRLANKMPQDTLDKLPVRKFLGTFDPSASASDPPGAAAAEGSQEEQDEKVPDASTRTDPESGDMYIRSEDAQCVICLDDYEQGDALFALPCGHHFHEKCLKDWFELSRLCPMCKRDLVDMANGGSGSEAVQAEAARRSRRRQDENV